MKRLFAFTMSLVSLNGMSFAAAASERYPTEAELQTLQQEFNQRLPELQADRSGVYRDRRTPTERQTIAAFTQAWANIDSTLAPFLGDWAAIEETMSIYPSRTPGQVCVLETFIPDLDASGVSISLGQVVGHTIRTRDRLILIRQGDFLGSTFVYEGKPGLYEYGNRRPLQDPATIKSVQKQPQILQQFRAAGCTANLP